MSSLTGIFSSGSPALVESLRTLVVTPKHRVKPGDIVRAEFAFSNLGGAVASGLRVRFSQPNGVGHLAQNDLVDDHPLAEGGSFADADGVAVDDLEPNATRRVVCEFRVDQEIENEVELAFQAAVIGERTPLVASNVERLVVESHPDLAGSGTLVTIVAGDDVRPGATISIRATIANTGDASAHDVIAVLPVPEHTGYVARSARIGGRVVAGDGEPFDFAAAMIVAPRLAPGQSVAVEYQATVEAPLEDGTRVRATAAICAREVAEFTLASAELPVHSPADFDNEETTLTLFCDDVVAPGTRVPVVVRALNAGTGAAHDVSVALELPLNLVYAPGTAHIDGQPVAIEGTEILFALGTLPSGRAVEIGCVATIGIPESDDVSLAVGAQLRWKGGARSFARRANVKTQPRFHRTRNFVTAERSVAQAGDEIRFTVHVFNDGTAPQYDARVRAIAGAYLDDVRISENGEEPMAPGEALAIGTIQPQRGRSFDVVARIVTPVPDRSTVSFGAALETENGAVDFGTASVLVRSRPHLAVQDVAWERASDEPLRPARTTDILVRFGNDGSDTLRDARLTLQFPPEIVLERAQDARRDRDGVAFGDVGVRGRHEARLTLRLLRPLTHGANLVLGGVLYGRGIGAFALPPLEIATFAAPDISRGAELLSTPRDLVGSGERVLFDLRLRNDGDGPAENLLIRVIPSNLVAYVPSSTTINSMAIPDDGGTSQLWSNRGLALTDVDPGTELHIRFEGVVISPLIAGTAIETRAVVECDGGETLALLAPTLRVEAAPALVETMLGTPLSIARTFPTAPMPPPQAMHVPQPEVALPSPVAPEATPPRAITELIEEAAPLPQRAPNEPQSEYAAPRTVAPAPARIEPEATFGDVPLAYIDFTPERIAGVLRLLERTDAGGGLIAHLFALRAFFPEGVSAGQGGASEHLAQAAQAQRTPLERFFVRLRMPRLAITGKDLEDREGRTAFERALADLSRLEAGNPPQRAAHVVRTIGGIDVNALTALAAELHAAPLGSATSWLINAQLLGSWIITDGGNSDALGRYRAQLIDVLGVLAELPLEEFHRVLTSSVNRSLDEALATVLDALRNAAHLAVD